MGVKCHTVFYATAGFLVFSGLILMIVLLALTVNKPVDQNEFRVTVNDYTGDMGDIKTQGRYNLKVGDQEIFLIRTVQTMSERRPCFTQDKILVTIDVNVLYEYIQDAIIPVIFRTFDLEEDYKYFFLSQIKYSSALACGNYTAQQFYNQRSSVAKAMENALQSLLSSTDLKYKAIRVTQLQLTNIEFPLAYSSVVSQKLATQQQQLIANNNRISLLIAANTTALGVLKDAEIYTINSKAQANIITAGAQTQAEINLNQFTERAAAFAAAKENFNLTDAGLVNYIKGEILRTTDNIVIGL